MKRYYCFVAGIALLIQLSACKSGDPQIWQSLDTGLSKAVFAYDSLDQPQGVVVYKIDSQYFTFELQSHSTAQSLRRWSEESGAIVTINGGYFHEDYTPSGLLIVDGKKVSSRQFDFDKSGALTIKDGRLEIMDLKNLAPEFEFGADHVLQSYPFYLKNGVESILEDSRKLGRRTAVGIDREGFIYLIVTPAGDLSLYALMKLMQTWPINFKDVLNLDGGMSSGLVTRGLNWSEEYNDLSIVPNVLLLRKKE